MTHRLADTGGEHSEHCKCLECFCAKQIARVERKAGPGIKARRQRRVKDLAAAHGDMVVAPFAHACLPNLDYYDNRRPRGER